MSSIRATVKNVLTPAHAAIALIGLGTAIRAALFIFNRSLYIDEAMLSLSIVSRSYAGLLKPLEYYQVAPLGFLFAEKLVTQLFGGRDLVLRLVPFLSGVASLLLVYFVAKNLLRPAGMVLTLTLFALSERLTHYSSEVKQYSSDVLIGLLLLFLAFRYLERPEIGRRYVMLVVFGCVSVWFSLPAFFVLAGVGFALMLARFSQVELRRHLILSGLIWGINFGVLYLVSLRSSLGNPVMQVWWTSFFMPISWNTPAWIAQAFVSLLQNPGPFSYVVAKWIGCPLLLLGAISISLRMRAHAPLILIPIGTTLLASALHIYPFGDRVVLFMLPMLFLLVGEGLDRIVAFALIYSRSVAWAFGMLLVVLMAYAPARLALSNLRYPVDYWDVKTVMAFLQQHQNGDPIYVYYGGEPAFRFYRRQFGLNSQNILMGKESRKDPQNYLLEIRKAGIRERGWVFFSHNCSWCTVNEERYLVSQLDKVASRIAEFQAEGASVYEYKFPPTFEIPDSDLGKP
jgi:hypothetical protein